MLNDEQLREFETTHKRIARLRGQDGEWEIVSISIRECVDDRGLDAPKPEDSVYLKNRLAAEHARRIDAETYMARDEPPARVEPYYFGSAGRR